MRGMSATSVCGPYSSRHRASTRRIARVSKRLLTPVRGTTPTAGSEPRCLTVSGAGEGRLTNSCSSFETQPRPYGKGNYNLTKGRAAQWGAGGAQAIADPSDRERARQDVVRGEIGLLQHRHEHPPVDLRNVSSERLAPPGYACYAPALLKTATEGLACSPF